VEGAVYLRALRRYGETTFAYARWLGLSRVAGKLKTGACQP